MQVFVYLSELHDRKLNAGHLGRAPQSKPSAGHAVQAVAQPMQQSGDEQVQPENEPIQPTHIHREQPQQPQTAKTIDLKPRKRGKEKKSVGAKLSSC